MKKLILFISLAIFAISGFSQATRVKDATANRYLKVNTDGSIVVNANKPTVVIGKYFTRPNKTANYVANDVVSNDSASQGAYLVFPNVVAANGGSGWITKVKLFISNATAINLQFKLHLYTVAPTAISDTAQFAMKWAQAGTRIGSWDFVTSTEGTGSDCAYAVSSTNPIEFSAGAASTTLYGVLEIKSAWASPPALTKFYVEITNERTTP